MEKDLLRKDKRGVSVMIGYVILIVIAIGLSVGVFAFLKLYLPKDVPVCPEEINLVVDDVVCDLSIGTVDLTVTNRGLFTVHRAQVRIGESDRIAKKLLNKDPFGFLDLANIAVGLKPGMTSQFAHPCDPDVNDQCAIGSKEIEVEPIVIIDNQLVLCENAVVSKIVNCI
jgi:hypothetical protein